MVSPKGLSKLRLNEPRSRGHLLEHKRAIAHGCADAAPRHEFALQDALGERIFDLLLDRALQRPRAVHRIKARLADEVARLIVELKTHIALEEARAQVAQLDVDNGADLRRP